MAGILRDKTVCNKNSPPWLFSNNPYSITPKCLSYQHSSCFTATTIVFYVTLCKNI